MRFCDRLKSLQYSSCPTSAKILDSFSSDTVWFFSLKVAMKMSPSAVFHILLACFVSKLFCCNFLQRNILFLFFAIFDNYKYGVHD